MADLAMRMPPADELALRWPEIEPILRRATRYTDGCYEPVDVLRQALAGQVGMWLIEDGTRLLGVAVSEARQYPRKRVLCVNFIAGRRLAEWWPLFVDTMDLAARRLGCQGIAAYGRPGWVRFWKARGIAMHIASEIMVRAL